MHFQIVQAGEDTFFGNPEAAGKDSEIKTLVCL